MATQTTTRMTETTETTANVENQKAIPIFLESRRGPTHRRAPSPSLPFPPKALPIVPG